jgi:hypothetical protein
MQPLYVRVLDNVYVIDRLSQLNRDRLLLECSSQRKYSVPASSRVAFESKERLREDVYQRLINLWRPHNVTSDLTTVPRDICSAMTSLEG